jgi:hypothetical protein
MPISSKINENTDPRPGVSQTLNDEDSLVAPVGEILHDDPVRYANELAFLNEEVEVMILPAFDPNDQAKLVDVSVNGKTFYFLRGQWRKCPRYVLEVLATAKSQAWEFGTKQAPTGATMQTQDSSYILRFPHHFKDLNPKGMAWYDSIKDRFH